MFPHFHKNISIASKFTDRNSHVCVIIMHSLFSKGHAVAQLFETLRYKPEGRGFDSRWCHWNFSLT